MKAWPSYLTAALLAVASMTAAAAAPATGPARGMELATYIQLHNGMSEGELLLRAGRPDMDSIENFEGAIVKSYYYFPTPSDPFITVIRLRGGVIVNLQRNRQMY